MEYDSYGLNANKAKKDQISKETQLEWIKKLKNPNISPEELDKIFSEVWYANKAYVVQTLNSTFKDYFSKNKEDMLQEAAIELFKALPTYDESKGMLTTFLKPRIIHAGMNFINEEIFHVSIHYGTHIGKIRSQINVFEAAGIQWTPYLLSETLDIPLKTVTECLDKIMASNTVHIDSSDYTRENFANPEAFERDPEKSAIAKSEAETIKKIMDKLDPQMRRVARLFYGFDGDPMPVTKIADRMGVDKNKVITWLNAANRIMKDMVQEQGIFYQPRIRDEVDSVCKEIQFIPKVTEEEDKTARLMMELDLKLYI